MEVIAKESVAKITMTLDRGILTTRYLCTTHKEEKVKIDTRRNTHRRFMCIHIIYIFIVSVS